MLNDELNLKEVYSSECDDLLHDFYIPVLKNSTKYSRITGFFSSRSLVAASQGLAHFFASGGEYYLITGAILSDDDFRIFSKDKQALENYLLKEFKTDELKNELEKDHLKVMAWLLSTGRLKIKVALMTNENKGIFHEKVGIFEDESGNRVSFSGSLNETGSGWLGNIEEFKVFKSWNPSHENYLERDREKFEKYWKGNTESLNIIDLPLNIKERVTKEAPVNELEIDVILEKIKKTESESHKRRPWKYQQEAIDNWIANDCCGIFEMATGTGKTLTALFAVREKMKDKGGIFIVVPTIHLIPQWKADVEKLFPNTKIVECHSKNLKWKQDVEKLLTDLKFESIDQFFILITPNSLVNKNLQRMLEKHYRDKSDWLIIADEMHTLGAPKFQEGLLDCFQKRIGLSATPNRKWDDEGNDVLEAYFKKTIYQFSLKRAIEEGFLVPYEYRPIFVHLSYDEFEDYGELSQQISKQSNFQESSENHKQQYEFLLRKRSAIIKDCKDKLPKLECLLQELKEKNIKKNILIYCNKGGQLDLAQEIVNKKGFLSRRFTSTENLVKREKILKDFANQDYDCLLAMKCLDEGVNIPSTEIAIILASTTNPREYIQRRGRILRRFEGKTKAIVYDLFVLPPEGFAHCPEARKLVKKEKERFLDFMDTALNKRSLMINDFFETI